MLDTINGTDDALIIGAGPAGLTAAYLLTKAGRRVTVLEQDPIYVGGISRTVPHDGFLFDIGGHRFFSRSAEVVALWNEILPHDFIDRPRLSRIFYGGKFYSYPLKAFEALSNLGLITSGLCVLSYLWAKLTPVRNPATFHQWVRNQFGERLFRIFFKTYTEKVWGMSCDAISADWAAQRIKGLDLRVAVWNALTREWRGGKSGPAAQGGGKVVKTLIESFRYPRRGPGMLWEEAARKTEAQGGTILKGHTASHLTWDAAAGQWVVTAARDDGSSAILTARNVISSAPIRELAAAITPPLASRAAAERLKYRDFLTVALMVRGGELFPDNWIYIHDPAVKVGRVQNFTSWSPEMVPDPKYGCLGLEYFCFEGDGLWTSSDTELVALATREVAHIGLVTPADVLGGVVVRQPKAYPVYDDTYKANVAAVRDEIEARFPTLHLVGRNGMHRYNNQDHAMMTAMLTVRNILAGECLFDVWNVNEDAEYHESGSEGERSSISGLRAVPAPVAAA